MDGDDMIPLVLAHVEQHPLPQHTGRAHHAVDRTPLLDRGGDDLLTDGELRNVAGHGDRRATRRLDLGNDRISDIA